MAQSTRVYQINSAWRGPSVAVGIPESVAELLRNHRLRIGIGQQELARRAGLSVRALRNIERERTRQPRVESLRRLMKAMNLSQTEQDRLLGLLEDAPRAAGVQVAILGPIIARRDSAPVGLGGAMGRRLLGVLALRPRQSVSRDELVDLLWDERPPRSATNLLHMYVAQLRARIEPARPARSPSTVVIHTPGGYLLDLDDEQVDLTWFDRIVGVARSLSGPEAISRYGEAFALWRGPVLAGAGDRLQHHPAAVAASGRRVSAVVAAVDLALAEGLTGQALAWLRAAVADEPLHERLHARLILALAEQGEPSAALRHYAGLRDRLVEELGVEPGAELRAAHLAVLRQDGTGGPPATIRLVPAQLPAVTASFVGRDEALAELDALLPERGGRVPERGVQRPPAVVISAIAGTAGVGKTALAVHWAHRVSDRFPDGQLYVDLRGFAQAPPLQPAEVLARFLAALGVPADRVPAEVEEAASLYRTLLSGRRFLVVLDNASDADQVRPLTPGDEGCLVLVTSRNRLDGLIARDGAHRILLDVLSPDESRQLLTLMLGAERTCAEPAATDELAQLCGHLPLALRIAAAKIAGSPHQTIGEYRDRLRTGDRLDALEVADDPRTAVRATVDLSYVAVPPPVQHLFRLMGLTDGPDIDAEAVAALLGAPAQSTGRALAQLAAAHLVDEPRAGRFVLHDLLRLCAAEYAVRYETEAARTAAAARLYAYYLDAADRASQMLKPQTLQLPPEAPSRCPPVGEPATVKVFQDRSQASGWLTAELPNLVAAARGAAAHGPRPIAWSLAAAMRGFFQSGALLAGEAVARAGLDAALAEHHPAGEAISRICLADVLAAVSRYDEAFEQYERALEITRRIGWRKGEATVLGNLAHTLQLAGRMQAAVDHLRQALALNRSIGWSQGEAVNHTNLGVVYWDLGCLSEASEHYNRAVELYRQIGSPAGEAIALTNLGETIDARGHHAQALQMLDTALAMHRENGNRVAEAYTLRCAAAAHRDLGALADALRLAQTALDLTRLAGHLRYEADTLNTLGSVRERLGQHREAIACHHAALRTSREANNRLPQVEALTGLGIAYHSLGEMDEARRCAEQAVALSQHGELVTLHSRAVATLDEIRRATAAATGQPD